MILALKHLILTNRIQPAVPTTPLVINNQPIDTSSYQGLTLPEQKPRQ